MNPQFEQAGLAEGMGLKLLLRATAELQHRNAQITDLQKQLNETQVLFERALGAHGAVWVTICEEFNLDPNVARVNFEDNVPVDGFPAGAILVPAVPVQEEEV